MKKLLLVLSLLSINLIQSQSEREMSIINNLPVSQEVVFVSTDINDREEIYKTINSKNSLKFRIPLNKNRMILQPLDKAPNPDQSNEICEYFQNPQDIIISKNIYSLDIENCVCNGTCTCYVKVQ